MGEAPRPGSWFQDWAGKARSCSDGGMKSHRKQGPLVELSKRDKSPTKGKKGEIKARLGMLVWAESSRGV